MFTGLRNFVAGPEMSIRFRNNNNNKIAEIRSAVGFGRNSSLPGKFCSRNYSRIGSRNPPNLSVIAKLSILSAYDSTITTRGLNVSLKSMVVEIPCKHVIQV